MVSPSLANIKDSVTMPILAVQIPSFELFSVFMDRIPGQNYSLLHIFLMFAEEEGRHGYCENAVSPLAVIKWTPHSRYLGMLVAGFMEELFTHISAVRTNLEENVLFFSWFTLFFVCGSVLKAGKDTNQDDQIQIQK